MKGPLDWGRWALKQGEMWGLSDGEARVLQVLAAHVDRDGVVAVGFLTEAEIGRRAAKNGQPRSPRTVRRLLTQLRTRGLVSTTQQGRRVARHQLHDILPVEQLTLDAVPTPSQLGQVTPRERFDRPKVPARPTGQPVNSLSTLTGQAVDRQERTGEVVAAAANAHEVNDGRPSALHPQLKPVLEILDALPEPYRQFEPAAVESALRAHPGKDVISAAHVVASRVHAGQAHTYHVNALLLGVLSRMTDGAVAAPTNTTRPAPSAPGALKARLGW